MSNPQFSFKKATRQKAKASIQLEGLSGSGKTGLALMLGYYLCGKDWNKVFGIDTENNSMPLYVGLTDPSGIKFGTFNHLNIDKEVGFKPSNYLAAREAALSAGAEAIISDSISHAWNYKGGILDMVNDAKSSNKRYEKDSYAAWSEPNVMREKNELLQLVRDQRAHIITTTRVKEKMEYIIEDGKSKLQSLGEQQIMQSEMKYEPDLVLHILEPANPQTKTYTIVEVRKSRYAIFKKGEAYEMNPSLMEGLVKYLNEGTDPEEILEQQRLEYIEALEELLKGNATKKAIWKAIKENAGLGDTKLRDLSLDKIKPLYLQLTAD